MVGGWRWGLSLLGRVSELTEFGEEGLDLRLILEQQGTVEYELETFT
jgi:hypothetical protein